MFAVPIQRVVFNNFLKVCAAWCLKVLLIYILAGVLCTKITFPCDRIYRQDATEGTQFTVSKSTSICTIANDTW